MFSKALLTKYQTMKAEEKIVVLRQAIHFDMPPLNLLFAVMLVLEPERVEEIAERLSQHQG